MLLYGASGHCKVIIDCLSSNNIHIDGIFDDNPALEELTGYKVLGSYSFRVLPDSEIILSIGVNKTRKIISQKIQHKFGSVIHPSAIVSKTASVNAGTVIFHASVIQPYAAIGKHAIINTAAAVDHDCLIEDYVHISPNAVLCGNVSVGEGTHVGAGSVVIQGIKIGKWATIGAGSVIIRDVPDYAVVVGNPGRIIKYNNV
jgi:sugar O-acyltransferase (sialic acid O-acetyltransferase NeuD family)